MDLELALENQDRTDQPLDNCDESLGKASPELSSPNPFAQQFVPEVWKLPIKNFVEEKPRGRQLTRQPDKGQEAEKRNDSMMSDGGLYKAEVVFIKDQEAAGSAGSTRSQPHKIKMSYKALAAIPTNTLLLEQQAIDEQVERHGEQLLEEDPHSEMCSPAQLRQQSEELYATIDKVLEDPTPLRQPSPVFRNSRERLDRGVTRHYTSSPRSMGRETKYATHNTQPLSPEANMLNPNKTKPGVIRPLNVGTRLMLHNEDDDDDDNEDYHRNPFRQYMEDLSNNGHSKSTHPIMTIHENESMISRGHENTGLENKATLCPGWSGGQEGSGKITTESGGSTEPLSLSALMISESERSHSCKRADRVWQRPPTFCCPAKPQTEPFETHI